jgi:hypothetical protein
VTELAVAYEETYRYADAVAVLEANDAALRDWPDRYLLAFNSVMSGDLDRAERHTAALSAPEGDWTAARDRLAGMLERSRHTTDRTVRGWHYILNASVLGSLSPYGYDEGMNGRYAFIQDSPANCARTLRRLRLCMPTRPASVSLLPDRSSRILGHAAATALDLPAVEWQPGQGDTVIVAYNLADVDANVLAGLRQRTTGSMLVEHATCWTDPPRVAAEFVGLLHQSVVTPWGSRLMAPPGGETYQTDPDDRAEDLVAAESASAADAPDEVAPGDDDDGYAEFVERIRDGWPPAAGQRDRVWSPGPIRSSYFA